MLQGGCVYSMNTDPVGSPIHLDHIIENHLYRRDANRINIIVNDSNGVMGEFIPNLKFPSYKPAYKTKFPMNMTEENLKENLMEIYNNGELLGGRVWPNLKYIRCQLTNIVVGIAKDEFRNTIVTAYPIFKYISLGDIENVDNDSSIYIATVCNLNKVTRKPESIYVSSKVSDLKAIKVPTKHRDCMSYRQEVGYTVYIKDISSLYTDTIFEGVKNDKGSILLEIRVDD